MEWGTRTLIFHLRCYTYEMKFAILKEFIKSPRTVGTIFPSSRHLASAMTLEIGLENARSVVEIGPGSGAFTGHIVEKLPHDAKFMSIELNKQFHSHLSAKHPKLKIINDSAERLLEILEREKFDKLDTVISGLPWSVFPETLQRKIIEQIYNALANGGYFATYAYFQGCFLPAGRKLKTIIRENFGEIKTSSLVLRNLPPAYVYRCKK